MINKIIQVEENGGWSAITSPVTERESPRHMPPVEKKENFLRPPDVSNLSLQQQYQRGSVSILNLPTTYVLSNLTALMQSNLAGDAKTRADLLYSPELPAVTCALCNEHTFRAFRAAGNSFTPLPYHLMKG